VRGSSYLLIAISHLVGANALEHSQQAFVLLDVPTLFLMASFSFFIYYFAQLSHQVELSRQSTYEEASMSMSRQGFSMGENMQRKSKMPNLIKPFFIVFNIFAFLAYLAISIYCTYPLPLLQFRYQESSMELQFSFSPNRQCG